MLKHCIAILTPSRSHPLSRSLRSLGFSLTRRQKLVPMHKPVAMHPIPLAALRPQRVSTPEPVSVRSSFLRQFLCANGAGPLEHVPVSSPPSAPETSSDTLHPASYVRTPPPPRAISLFPISLLPAVDISLTAAPSVMHACHVMQ